MRIVSWNCNGALRKKLAPLDSLDADIFIIQECEDPARSTKAYQDWAKNYLWKGESKNKGIGIFARSGIDILPLNWFNTFEIKGLDSQSKATTWNTNDLKLFLPFSVNARYNILAAWTKGSRDHTFGYIGQLWKYLKLHSHEIVRNQTMIVGDLNSNSIWDEEDRWWNHSDVVSELYELGLKSLYHSESDEKQGCESQATFFLQRKIEKPYHIDYAFIPEAKIDHSDIEIGKPSEWIEFSDHMPLIINLGE